MDCKYPGLKAAIEARKDMKIRVTPEQSVEVQKIAFECGFKWIDNNQTIHYKDREFLYIGTPEYKKHIIAVYASGNWKEFSLDHDCFVDEIKHIETKHPKNKFGEYLKVFNLIANEIQRAEKLHGELPDYLMDQVAILNEESGEVTKAALDHVYSQKPIDDVYTEAIHTAAVAVRILLNRRDK